MGSRARDALIAFVVVASAPHLAAQNPTPATPPTPPRDSMAREQVLNEIIPPGASFAPRATLIKGTVYRVDIQPGSAVVNVRSARRPSLPPLFMIPLEGGGLTEGASQTAAFLMVPSSTEEYRFDVGAYGGESVRLRVETDPREMARWTRIHNEGFRTPILAASLRLMYLTRFRDAHSSPLDSVAGLFTTPQSAMGIKGCLAVVPHGRVLPDRLGGCAIALTFWRRASGRDFFTLGIEPEVVVRRGATWEISVMPQLAFGNTTAGAPRTSYVLVGAGARYAVAFAKIPTLGFQAEASLVNVRSGAVALDPRSVSAIALSLGAGFILSL